MTAPPAVPPTRPSLAPTPAIVQRGGTGQRTAILLGAVTATSVQLVAGATPWTASAACALGAVVFVGWIAHVLAAIRARPERAGSVVRPSRERRIRPYVALAVLASVALVSLGTQAYIAYRVLSTDRAGHLADPNGGATRGLWCFASSDAGKNGPARRIGARFEEYGSRAPRDTLAPATCRHRA